MKGREIYFSAFVLLYNLFTETANLKITLAFAVLKIIN